MSWATSAYTKMFSNTTCDENDDADDDDSYNS